MATLYSPKIVTDGLKVYYDFSNTESYGGSGTTVYDLSLNQDGVINGATFGTYGGVDSLDFAGNYGTAGFIDSSTTNVTQSSFTVLIWCRSTDDDRANGVQGRVVASTYDFQGSPTTQDTGWYMGTVWTGTYFYFQIYNGTGGNATANFSSNWYNSNLNKWNCMVGVFSAGAYVRGFQNGVQIANSSTAITTLSSQDDKLIWGRRSAESQSNWKGQIAMSMYYDRALTNEEVFQNYNATKGRFGL
jgi:hypothetical protein